MVNFLEDFESVYRVIHKPLRYFRPLQYCSRDGHAEGEHVNRGRDTPIFCPTLQVLDIPTLGDAADVNPVIKFLPHTCNVCCMISSNRHGIDEVFSLLGCWQRVFIVVYRRWGNSHSVLSRMVKQTKTLDP